MTKPPYRPVGGLTTQLDSACDDLLKASHALPSALRAMRDAMKGQPGAQSFDVIAPGLGTVLYCETHDRDLTDCHSKDLGCDGVPVLVTQDPTGDAGVERALGHDVARNDQREAQRLCAQAELIAGHLVRLVARWHNRPPTEVERRRTDMINEPGCEFHARAGTWVPPFVLSSTVAGALDHPVRACRDCYERIRTTGAEPAKPDLEHHVTTGKWPRSKAA